MPKPHYAARRDANEQPLVAAMEALGGYWIADGPFDGWLHWRGAWHLIEIKDPKKAGHKSEYTANQVRMLISLRERGIELNTLRTEDDVYRLMGARRSA